MDKNERIAPALRDKRGGHDRLAEGGRRREHAMVMRTKRFERLDLRLVQRALKPHSAASGSPIIRRSFTSTSRTLAADQLNSFVEASPGQPHMARVKFGAGDDPGLPKVGKRMDCAR